uniref:Putative secreted protein n=1 Tax=Anopheles darlingi TaxID=43151 RepID=A0A2M4D4V4_ANODA
MTPTAAAAAASVMVVVVLGCVDGWYALLDRAYVCMCVCVYVRVRSEPEYTPAHHSTNTFCLHYHHTTVTALLFDSSPQPKTYIGTLIHTHTHTQKQGWRSGHTPCTVGLSHGALTPAGSTRGAGGVRDGGEPFRRLRGLIAEGCCS